MCKKYTRCLTLLTCCCCCSLCGCCCRGGLCSSGRGRRGLGCRRCGCGGLSCGSCRRGLRCCCGGCWSLCCGRCFLSGGRFGCKINNYTGKRNVRFCDVTTHHPHTSLPPNRCDTHTPKLPSCSRTLRSCKGCSRSCRQLQHTHKIGSDDVNRKWTAHVTGGKANLRQSQWVPLQPSSQTHRYMLTSSSHVPCSHGLDAHSSISAMKTHDDVGMQ